MSELATHTAIEGVARDSFGQLIAYLAARAGDIAGAQDALSEALVAALVEWPMDGVAQKPGARLLHAERNRLTDTRPRS